MDSEQQLPEVARRGSTLLLVADGQQILSVIEIKNMVKSTIN
ncbi:hypothetical protein [Psychrobacter sp. JCM 18902]|nr:hypothetical protein [Psychrobacter sp. JCM 18902]